MTRKLIISITLIIVAVVALFAFACSRTSQDELAVENPEGSVYKLPVYADSLHTMVEVLPGLRFKLDTGSDLTTITPRDLALLDSLGFKAEKSFYPVMGRDGRGDTHFETERYRLSVPVCSYTIDIDSTGVISYHTDGSQANIIHNIDFVLSHSGFSVLGIDFLEKFKVEYSYNDKTISFHDSMPEGYQKITDIEPSASPIQMLWLGKRYYINIKTERKRDNYFIDTGLRNASIKLPAAERTRSRRQLSDTVLISARGQFPGVIDKHAWLIFGDRAGTYQVCYYDNDEEGYAINPINLFDQDIILDFDNRALMLRPYSMTDNDRHSNALSSIRVSHSQHHGHSDPEMEPWLDDIFED